MHTSGWTIHGPATHGNYGVLEITPGVLEDYVIEPDLTIKGGIEELLRWLRTGQAENLAGGTLGGTLQEITIEQLSAGAHCKLTAEEVTRLRQEILELGLKCTVNKP